MYDIYPHLYIGQNINNASMSSMDMQIDGVWTPRIPGDAVQKWRQGNDNNMMV